MVENLFNRLSKEIINRNSRSKVITNQKTIKAFKSNPENTFLVSFPRTGSHWLRMVTELYFGRPSLVRVFYYYRRSDYLMLHTHDLDLDLVRKNVIYLYRNPVETIYSLLNYHRESTQDRKRVAYWADLYGRHLDKWLNQETFTKQKTIMTYEGMKNHFANEFEKLTRHFGQSLERDKLEKAVEQVSKDEVRKKTTDDPQVIYLNLDYESNRELFNKEQGPFVWEVLLNNRLYLENNFQN